VLPDFSGNSTQSIILDLDRQNGVDKLTTTIQPCNKDAAMINLTFLHFDGQAYELTDRYTHPQSSSARLHRDDHYSTFQLIASLPLQLYDWSSILRRASASPIKLGSNHSGEVYQAVTEAIMRGELRLYRLPRVDAFNSVRGKQAKKPVSRNQNLSYR
jgi:hypothetical protein